MLTTDPSAYPWLAVACRLKTCRAPVGHPCITPTLWGARRVHEPRQADYQILLAVRCDRWGWSRDAGHRKPSGKIQHLLQPGHDWTVCGVLAIWDQRFARKSEMRACKRCLSAIDRVQPPPIEESA